MYNVIGSNWENSQISSGHGHKGEHLDLQIKPSSIILLIIFIQM